MGHGLAEADPLAREPDRLSPKAVVGVVVAAYNAERHLGEALSSVCRQSLSSWVCVVVNDGSLDETAAVAEQAAAADGRIRLISRQNGGVSAARNTGLSALPPEVEYVCFLDSDDILFEDGLEKLLTALEERPDAVAATGWADTIDEASTPVSPGEHRATQSTRLVAKGLRVGALSKDEDTSFASLAVYGTIWPPATALIRRQVAADIGGFDERLSSQEDWDLFLRASRRGPIIFADEQVAWYRRHPANSSADLAGNLHFASVVRHKAWKSTDNTPEQRRDILLAGLRLNAYELQRELSSLLRSVRTGRPANIPAHLARIGYFAAQLLAVRPLVPPRPIVEQIHALGLRNGGAGPAE